MRSIIKTAPIVALAVTLNAPSAQSETLKTFGERISRSASAMMTAHRHTASANTWKGSDYQLLTRDAEYLEDALRAANQQCRQYNAGNRSWTSIGYTQRTNAITAEMAKGLPTFAPSPAQQQKIHSVFLAAATAFEAEKVVCPSIVWRR